MSSGEEEYDHPASDGLPPLGGVPDGPSKNVAPHGADDEDDQSEGVVETTHDGSALLPNDDPEGYYDAEEEEGGEEEVFEEGLIPTRPSKNKVGPNNKTLCARSGCNKQSQGPKNHYMCRKHYCELQKTLHPTLDAKTVKELGLRGKKKRAQCSIDGCTRQSQGGTHNHMCRTHYIEDGGIIPGRKPRQKRPPKPPGLPKEKTVNTCRVEGCQKLSQGSRNQHMCRRHFTLSIKAAQGDEDAKEAIGRLGALATVTIAEGPKKPTRPLCAVPNCPKQSQGKGNSGFCRSHYRQLTKAGVPHMNEDVTLRPPGKKSARAKGSAAATAASTGGSGSRGLEPGDVEDPELAEMIAKEIERIKKRDRGEVDGDDDDDKSNADDYLDDDDDDGDDTGGVAAAIAASTAAANPPAAPPSPKKGAPPSPKRAKKSAAPPSSSPKPKRAKKGAPRLPTAAAAKAAAKSAKAAASVQPSERELVQRRQNARDAVHALEAQLADARGKEVAMMAAMEGMEECVLCQEEAKAVPMMPCGHMAICHSCTYTDDKCPICLQPIERAEGSVAV